MLHRRIIMLLAAILAISCGCRSGVGQKAKAVEVPPEMDNGAEIV
jgi:hypothetical protein